MDDLYIGKYRIIEELGRGGFGTVYKAHDTVLDVDRALKVLHPALVTDRNFLERFRQEAQLAAKLDHPHIVPVYDFGEDDGRFFLAMKYMSGGSLKALIDQQGPLGEEQALEVLEQIADGLDFAHSKGIIHRDLKPSNFLFDHDGNLLIGDFGFAKFFSERSGASISLSGGMLGTPEYMAPELWRGKPATPASDIYSMGCILYEMLTGKVLFDGESLADVMTKHILDGPESMDLVPEKFVIFISNALSKDPTERFLSMKNFTEFLKRSEIKHDTVEIDSKLKNASSKVNDVTAKQKNDSSEFTQKTFSYPKNENKNKVVQTSENLDEFSSIDQSRSSQTFQLFKKEKNQGKNIKKSITPNIYEKEFIKNFKYMMIGWLVLAVYLFFAFTLNIYHIFNLDVGLHYTLSIFLISLSFFFMAVIISKYLAEKKTIRLFICFIFTNLFMWYQFFREIGILPYSPFISYFISYASIVLSPILGFMLFLFLAKLNWKISLIVSILWGILFQVGWIFPPEILIEETFPLMILIIASLSTYLTLFFFSVSDHSQKKTKGF